MRILQGAKDLTAVLGTHLGSFNFTLTPDFSLPVTCPDFAQFRWRTGLDLGHLGLPRACNRNSALNIGGLRVV